MFGDTVAHTPLRQENMTAALYVAQQFLTFIIASHRENDDEKISHCIKIKATH
ncbi:MAG: hypothetical protein CBARDCOR_2144 [uncultured Caballeronia sp.]|nr:MAG: hypothetical protein CBARDCOR_2144 [uncultured Caballeronia sp.]